MNRRLAKMEQRKKALVAHSKSILDAAEKDSREITAAEQGLLNNNTQELESVSAGINEEVERCGYTDNPTIGGFDGDDYPGAIPGSGNAAKTRTAHKGGIVGARYASLFPGDTSSNGWANLTEFFNGIHSGMADPRLQMLSEGSGPSGGFLTPTQFAPMLLDPIIESSLILPRCRVYPMTTNELRVPGFDTSTAASGVLFGGITAQWLGESETADVTNPTTRQIRLISKKLGLLISVTNELSADALNLESQISGALQSAASWFVDDALLNGSGVGQPSGILTDSACIEVAIEGGQDPDTIVVENLQKMFCRLHPSCIPNSVWIASVTTIPQLLSLSIPIGLAGDHVKVMSETDGKFSMFSRPVLFSEKMASLGDKGDIALIDPTQYSVGLRSELSIEKSGHIYFLSDQTAYRALIRLDGMGTWSSTYQPKNGDTLSWAVTLAERA